MNYMKLFNMKTIHILFYIFILLTTSRGDDVKESEAYLSHFKADLWLEIADVIKIIWRDCSKKLVDAKDVIDYKDNFPKFVRCMKRKTLEALDRSLDSDVISIANGVNLVRFEKGNETGNAISSSLTEMQIEEEEWRSLALQRIAKILKTHVIQFDFDDTKITDKAEFRGRRRHHVMTMMMFGIVSMGMVLVPMGFQFLAVLGGKALLLAKMALMLASMQGFKKVASPLNYGFYPSYPFEHYEKRSIGDWTTSTMAPSSLSSKSNVDKERTEQATTKKHTSRFWKANIVDNTNEESEAKLYPGMLPSVFPSADPSTPVLDFTSSPNEVQADYTLEMPYNRFRFQSSTPIVPSRHIRSSVSYIN